MTPIRRTKKQELTEQLALENAVRLGLVACFINLVVEHARVVGGDQSKALTEIKTAMQNTASSLKVKAKDAGGDEVDISSFIQRNVSKMIDSIIRDAQKRISKSVH